MIVMRPSVPQVLESQVQSRYRKVDNVHVLYISGSCLYWRKAHVSADQGRASFLTNNAESASTLLLSRRTYCIFFNHKYT